MGYQSPQYLLVDTNIVQFINSEPKDRSDKLGQLILAKETQGLIRAISTVTIYEAIQNCDQIKESKVIKSLEDFAQLEVSKTTLQIAGWFSDLYRMENISDSQISTCDKIIASSAFLMGSKILTADANDFPRPFCNEVFKENIIY